MFVDNKDLKKEELKKLEEELIKTLGKIDFLAVNLDRCEHTNTRQCALVCAKIESFMEWDEKANSINTKDSDKFDKFCEEYKKDISLEEQEMFDDLIKLEKKYIRLQGNIKHVNDVLKNYEKSSKTSTNSQNSNRPKILTH